jgi:mandelamide amidase
MKRMGKIIVILIVMSLFSLCVTVAAFAEAGETSLVYSYNLPFFAASSTEWSGLGISNDSRAVSANLTFVAYDKDGEIVATEDKTLPANGQDAFVVGSGLSTEGWVKIQSDQPLSGLCFLGSSSTGMAYVPISKNTFSSLLIPHVVYDSFWDTEIFIANPNSALASVTLTYGSADGQTSSSVLYTLSANCSKKIELSELTNNVVAENGKVNISSSIGIVAAAICNDLKAGGGYYAGICAVEPGALPDCTLINEIQKAGGAEAAARASVLKAAENRDLNAFIHLAGDEAVALAAESDKRIKQGKPKGPLDGVLLVVKDNIHVAGMPNSAGTPALKNFMPQENATVIDRLQDAGAIILGKTNMHELAFGISSYNSAFYEDHIGVRNVYDIERMAGGSSGGTAVAIASGIVFGGLGTDTGGSARIPAALNGIVGFRATVGRYPGDGVTPISHTRDTVGPLAADVKSVALLDSVMSGENMVNSPAEKDGLRLGVASEFLANMEPEIGVLWEEATAAFKAAGIVIVEVDAAEIYRLNALIGFPVALYEGGVDMRAYLEKYNVGITIEELAAEIASPDVKATYDALVVPGKLVGPDGSLIDAKPVYEDAINTQRPLLIQEYKKLFSDNQLDALLFPTTPAVAKIANQDSSSLANFLLFIQNTDPGSDAGMPGLTMPMGLTADGLAAGIEIDGLPGDDSRLLSIGMALEEILQQ